MSTQTEERAEPTPAPRRTWMMPAAAAAAFVLAIGGVAVFGGGLGGDPVATGPAVQLEAGAEDVFASCIAFSAEELAKVADLAFRGTVTAVDGATVTLAVDHWYLGGDASEVELNAPLGMEALIGGIPFEVGDSYLVSAQDGNVNYCGFSGPTTPEYQAAFEQAFGG